MYFQCSSNCKSSCRFTSVNCTHLHWCASFFPLIHKVCLYFILEDAVIVSATIVFVSTRPQTCPFFPFCQLSSDSSSASRSHVKKAVTDLSATPLPCCSAGSLLVSHLQNASSDITSSSYKQSKNIRSKSEERNGRNST